MGDPVLDAIDRLATLPAGWDSYGAPAIEREALERARWCLSELRTRLGAAYRDPEVGPDVGGGVELIWEPARGSYEVHALVGAGERFKVLVLRGDTLLTSAPAKSIEFLAGVLTRHLQP